MPGRGRGWARRWGGGEQAEHVRVYLAGSVFQLLPLLQLLNKHLAAASQQHRCSSDREKGEKEEGQQQQGVAAAGGAAIAAAGDERQTARHFRSDSLAECAWVCA